MVDEPYDDVEPYEDPDLAELEAEWPTWLLALFPEYVYAPFGRHHAEYWDHIWSIRPDDKPDPYVAVWSRGHAKSTGAELGVVALGARRIRKYAVYICSAQEQADDHVSTIASMLESSRFADWYPAMAERSLGK